MHFSDRLKDLAILLQTLIMFQGLVTDKKETLLFVKSKAIFDFGHI